MKNYKLLTPGPLTTTDTVKKEMLFDHCTWDDDYKQITQEIRKELLKLAHVSEEDYTVVLMQGSGTFGVESVLTSVIGEDEKLLIAANGAYGKRMASIAEHAKIDYVLYEEDFDKVPDAGKIAEYLDEDAKITHVAMVHSETTSGILNDIESVAKAVKKEERHLSWMPCPVLAAWIFRWVSLALTSSSAAPTNVFREFRASPLLSAEETN